MRPSLVTAYMTAAAMALAVPIGLFVWEAIIWVVGFPILTLMIIITTIIVAIPLAFFLGLTLAWGWQQQQDLYRKESLLRSAQHMAKLGHWRWVVGTDYYLLSEDICPIYGVSPEDPRLHLDRLFEIMHPDDRAATRNALRSLLEEHRPQEIEYRVRGQDGTYQSVWVDGRCEYDANGQVIAIFGVVQDITERKRIENDLRRALDRAEVANRAKSEFLASMSHELRTPLNAILGFSEMIRDERLGPVSNPRYTEYAADIHDSGSHLLALINGLLDVAKIEAGRYDLREEPLDLNVVVERAARTMQPVAGRKEQRIDLDLPPTPHVVHADGRALHQILLNLLSNAIKFSHRRGTIRIRVSATPDAIAIMVEDHGIGIPSDKLPHVGKPFFQAHEGTARIAGGTGIGLSVTRALVERLSGTLSIASRHGEGTCVTVRLPGPRLLADASTTAA